MELSAEGVDHASELVGLKLLPLAACGKGGLSKELLEHLQARKIVSSARLLYVRLRTHARGKWRASAAAALTALSENCMSTTRSPLSGSLFLSSQPFALYATLPAKCCSVKPSERLRPLTVDNREPPLVFCPSCSCKHETRTLGINGFYHREGVLISGGGGSPFRRSPYLTLWAPCTPRRARATTLCSACRRWRGGACCQHT